MTIKPYFHIGDIVYVKTDPDQLPRIVSCYLVSKNSILYNCRLDDEAVFYSDFELSHDRDLVVATNG